jgi:hypothetical protein
VFQEAKSVAAMEDSQLQALHAELADIEASTQVQNVNSFMPGGL